MTEELNIVFIQTIHENPLNLDYFRKLRNPFEFCLYNFRKYSAAVKLLLSSFITKFISFKKIPKSQFMRTY